MKLILYFILSIVPYQVLAPPAETLTDCDVFKIYTTITLPFQLSELSDIDIPKGMDLKHLQLLLKRADELNIPKRLLFRLIWKESRYNPYAISPKRAFSYMQVMPETFKIYSKRLNYNGYHTPEMNIIIGTQMLFDLHEYWEPKVKNKAWIYTLASYNAGKGKVIKHKGIPPYKETIDFVAFIQK